MVFFHLVGCAQPEEDIGPVITGEVIRIEGDRFLVVEENRPEIQEIWFTTDKIYTVHEGLTVTVWSYDVAVENGIAEGTAEKFVIE